MRKKLSWLIYIISIIVMAILQTSFFPQFILLKVKPDLLLLFVISVGLLKGYREGVLVGVLAGFLAGLISWNLCGIYILGYCFAGFVAGLVPEKIEPDNFIIPVVSSAAGSLGFSIYFLLAGQSLELFFPVLTDLYRILAFLAWNAILSIPVFLLSRYVLVSPGVDMDTVPSGIKSGYILE